MTWLVDMSFLGRWLLALGISALFLLLATTYRHQFTSSSHSTMHRALVASGHMIAFSGLTLIWMWTLEPIQVEAVRVLMSLALALGLGSLMYRRSTTDERRQVSVVNSAGALLGVLTVVALVSY